MGNSSSNCRMLRKSLVSSTEVSFTFVSCDFPAGFLLGGLMRQNARKKKIAASKFKKLKPLLKNWNRKIIEAINAIDAAIKRMSMILDSVLFMIRT
jgi:hypothetical protein